MTRFIGRCKRIDPLDGVTSRLLDELIIPALIPVDREAHYNEGLISSVVQA